MSLKQFKMNRNKSSPDVQTGWSTGNYGGNGRQLFWKHIALEKQKPWTESKEQTTKQNTPSKQMRGKKKKENVHTKSNIHSEKGFQLRNTNEVIL